MRMRKTILSFLLSTLTMLYTSAITADGLISYAGLNIHYSSVNLDEFGATSLEDDSVGFSLFAASRLYKKLYLEYGYKDLGKYTADYDFTVGSFRLVESHSADFSTNIYTGLVLKASLADIFDGVELSSGLGKVYLHAGLGALLWSAKLEMSGELYDSSTLLSPYSGSGDDNGLSHYFELGMGYELNTKLILNLIFSTYFDVGRGIDLQRHDGSQEEYSGIDIDTASLGLTYSF
jgi:hypothetical protein